MHFFFKIKRNAVQFNRNKVMKELKYIYTKKTSPTNLYYLGRIPICVNKISQLGDQQILREKWLSVQFCFDEGFLTLKYWNNRKSTYFYNLYCFINQSINIYLFHLMFEVSHIFTESTSGFSSYVWEGERVSVRMNPLSYVFKWLSHFAKVLFWTNASWILSCKADKHQNSYTVIKKHRLNNLRYISQGHHFV